MIASLVKLLRPVFLPILKLDLQPPHLPEGSTLVRQLKPEPAWLTLKYLGALLGTVGAVAGALVGSAALIRALGDNDYLYVAMIVVDLLVLGALGFTLVAVRLDYELRHYLVGDKSLRVSQGALVRREVTLSYSNVQNLEVNAGPIERLFGLSSLTISTAGGSARPGEANPHQATLEGLKNADEVKHLILGMLEGQKDSGLGDLSEGPHSDRLDPAALEEVRLAALNLRNVAESLAVSVDFRQPAKN